MKKKSPDAISVLVVDDHPVVREGVSAMIDQQPDLCVAAEAASGDEAVSIWNEKRPDIVLLDLELGRLTGLEVLRRILAHDSQAKVIVLTTFDLEEDIFQALSLGARGYLLKDSSRRELVDSIRRVAGGERVVPPEVAARLADRLAGVAPTPREVDVLIHLRDGLANKEIADRLSLSEGTVKTHITNLMQKLQAASRTDVVVKAISKGWLRRRS